MQVRTRRPEFLHVAEHSDPACASGHVRRREQIERRADGGRVRVIGVVDEIDRGRIRVQRQGMPTAAPLGRAPGGQGQRRPGDVAAGRADAGEDGERVQGEVRPRRAHAEQQVTDRRLGRAGGAVGARRQRGHPPVASLPLSEGHRAAVRQDVRHPEVRVPDRRAVRLQPVEDRRLFPRDAGQAIVEGFQMDGRHVEHGRDMGSGLRRQRCDLAGVVHPDLDDRELRIGGDRRQRQRHAPVVVEAADRGMRLALNAQAMTQHLLGRGLADAAGHGDHPSLGPRSPRPAERLERRLHVRDQQQRRVLATLGHAAHQRGRSTRIQRRADETVPVARRGQGHEHLSGLDGPAVDPEAGDGPTADGLPARRTGSVGGRPERHASRPSSAATQIEACSTSSKGRTMSPTV